MPAGAAAQFKNVAAARHVATQHVEEHAIIDDPSIDNIAAQLPHVSILEHLDPVVAVRGRLCPDQHAVHWWGKSFWVTGLWAANDDRFVALGHFFVTEPLRRIADQNNR